MPNTLKMFKNITILYMNSIFEYNIQKLNLNIRTL